MRKVVLTTAAALILGTGISAPALAQATQPSPQTTTKPAKDPNEVVCERQEEIGTRLGSQKICKTRAEWAEERRSNRQTIEKIQTQRDLNH